MAGEHQKPYGAQQYQPYYVQEAYLDPTYRIEQPYAGPAAQEVTVVGTAVTSQPLPEVIVIEQQRVVAAGGTPPRAYCFLAWFACLFCCWPVGLMAVIMSIKVSNKMRNNDFQGAYQASRSARRIAVIAIVTGIVMQVVYWTSYAGNSESSSARSNRST